MSQRVLFIQHCHMDPVWRRCFDRPAVHDGTMLRSYAEIEAAQINAWLELAQRGVAILNKGLPCFRWTPGRFDFSLLRSPEMPFCNVVVDSHDFWDIDGWRDTGHHRFEYALFPYCDAVSEGELTRIGYAYNRPAPLTPPFAVDGDVVVTAWKCAQDGSGWILRLYDAGGHGTPVRLTFPTPRTVTPVNLLEQAVGEPTVTAQYETAVHTHGILTVLIQ